MRRKLTIKPIPEILEEQCEKEGTTDAEGFKHLTVLTDWDGAETIYEAMVDYYQSKSAGGLQFSDKNGRQIPLRSDTLPTWEYVLFSPPGGTLKVIAHPELETHANLDGLGKSKKRESKHRHTARKA